MSGWTSAPNLRLKRLISLEFSFKPFCSYLTKEQCEVLGRLRDSFWYGTATKATYKEAEYYYDELYEILKFLMKKENELECIDYYKKYRSKINYNNPEFAAVIKV